MKRNLKSIGEARNLVSSLRGYNIILTTHKNADPDALASLFVMYNLLELQKNNVYIVLPEGLNEAAKRVVEGFRIDIEFHGPDTILYGLYTLFDKCIILDTSSSSQLGPLYRIIDHMESIVVDHHKYGDLAGKADIVLIDPGSRSNSELVYKLIEGIYTLNSLESTLLLTGIIYDTRRFIHVSPRTFYIVYKLLSYGGDYSRALEILRREMDYSEKIARLKAAQRMEFEKCSNYIVAVTHVGAFESSAANALIELGADIAIVYSIRKNNIRITLRSNKRFHSGTGISLARDIVPHIEDLIRGIGGGHDTAASIEGEYIPSDIDKALFKIICGVLKKY